MSKGERGGKYLSPNESYPLKEGKVSGDQKIIPLYKKKEWSEGKGLEVQRSISGVEDAVQHLQVEKYKGIVRRQVPRQANGANSVLTESHSLKYVCVGGT